MKPFTKAVAGIAVEVAVAQIVTSFVRKGLDRIGL